MPRLPLLRLLSIVCLSLALTAQTPRRIQVAAAADLKWALADICQAFSLAHPEIQVAVTYGSSGQFFAQLTQKAPFDVFLSADLGYVRKLQEQGLGRPGSLFTYGIGRLVLWVPAESQLNLDKRGLEAVLDPSIRRLAIANPLHAPYGRAAQSALEASGLLARVQSKLVLGENIAQAAQFTQTGAAQAGLLALSLARAPELAKRGRVWLVPSWMHPSLEQGGLILGWARDPGAAEAFCAFLQSAQGSAILRRYGIEPVR